jgi:taurine dioxygenase
MMWSVVPSGQACGARIEGIDLSYPLGAEAIAELRNLWLKHHVLAFPGQSLTPADLERITLYFGRFSHDPFIAPIPDHEHVIAVERRSDEMGTIFAEAWHSDWSFMETPPDGTMLYGIKIPPEGGDTLFANQHLAWSAMPDVEKRRLRNGTAVHSAKRAYAPEGFYGQSDERRSMSIRPSQSANAVQRHPLVKRHPENGLEGLFGCAGYIIEVEGLSGSSEDELQNLLLWQTQDAFVYRHSWEADMLVIWDNRSVLHRATGGYEGHHRLLHRTTIGSNPQIHALC